MNINKLSDFTMRGWYEISYVYKNKKRSELILNLNAKQAAKTLKNKLKGIKILDIKFERPEKAPTQKLRSETFYKESDCSDDNWIYHDYE